MLILDHLLSTSWLLPPAQLQLPPVVLTCHSRSQHIDTVDTLIWIQSTLHTRQAKVTELMQIENDVQQRTMLGIAAMLPGTCCSLVLT